MLNISLSILQEELSKEFFGTMLPARLEKFDGLLKGPFFLGDKVRHMVVLTVTPSNE